VCICTAHFDMCFLQRRRKRRNGHFFGMCLFLFSKTKEDKMFICTGCQKEYENQTKFCSECGGKIEEKIEIPTEVKYICSGCQKEYDAGTKFCSECGGKVTEKITVPPVYTCCQCQKEYDENTKFCSACGGKVAVQQAVVQPVTPAQPAAQPVAVQPATVQPVAVQPAPVQPAAVQPATVQPVAVQPAPVQPAAVQPIPGIDKKTVKKNKIKSIASIIVPLLALGCAIGLPLMNKYIEKITKESQEAAVQTLKKLQDAVSDDDIKKLIIPSARDNRKLFENISKLNLIMLSGEKVTFSDYKVKPDQQVAVKVSWSDLEGTVSAAVLVTKEKDQWFISDCTDVKGPFD